MAVQNATIKGGTPDYDPIGSTTKPPPKGTILVEWAAMAGGDTGQWVQLGNYGDKSVSIGGTPGTSTITIEGTNEVDGSGNPVNGAVLRSPDSVVLSFTTLPQLRQVLENTRFIRPAASAGTGSGIVVRLYGRKDKFASGA